MNFPGGYCELPAALTCNGTSGPNRVWQPEQPRALDRLTDEQLERLAGDLDKLVTTALRDGDADSLTDYIALLSAQVQSEMLTRMARAHGL